MPSQLIGALRVSLSADTAEFQKGMDRAEKKASTSSSAISASLGRVKGAVAGLAGGLLAGLSISAFTQAAQGAFDYADAITDLADRTGATTRVIQEFRYAAQMSGSSVEVADEALGRFARTLGLAQSGGAAQVKMFRDLGVTSSDFDAAFRETLDGLERLPTVQERNAKAMQIFGRSASTLTGLLGQGSDGFNELAQRASDLGIVLSDDLVRNAGQVNDQLDTMKMIIDARMSSAIVENADSILAFADALVTLIDKAAGALQGLRDLGSGIRQLRNSGEGWTFGLPNSGEAGRRGRLNYFSESLAQQFPDGGRPKPTTPRPTASAGRGGGTLPTGGAARPRGKSPEQLANEAQRKREEALRQQYSLDREELDGRRSLLSAQRSLVRDYVERNDLSVQLVDLDRQATEKQIAFDQAMGDINGAEAARRRALADQLAVLDKQLIGMEQEQKRVEEAAHLSDVDFGLRREALDGESALAETAAERREVELRILDLAYEEQRERIARLRSSGDWRDAEEASKIEASLPGAYNRDRAGIMQGTRGPWEQFLASIPDTAAKANEALESVAAGGMSSLIDGLTEAMMGARSLGDVFQSVAQQIIADLLRIQLQKALVGALGSSLAGALGIGGGLQWKGTGGLNTGGLPALAGGGILSVLGNRGVDTNLLSINGTPAAMVNRGERIRVDPNNNSARGAPVSFDLRGAVMTQDLLVQMQGIAASTSGSMLSNNNKSAARQRGRIAGRGRV